MRNNSEFTKYPGETRTFYVSLSDKLCSPELLTGTPTVAEVGSADLMISGVGLNEDINDPYHVPAVVLVPADTSVVFTVAGGTRRTDYTLRVTVTTDGTPAQTLIQDIRLQVV